jgi:hypothetical protein
MTTYGDWLSIQNGVPPAASNTIDPDIRYIRNGRDLGEWLHHDFSYQGYLGACSILLGFGAGALDQANPYLTSATQSGLATFGSAHILDLVARAARSAYEAAWYQKWLVHRRLRPEEFGGRLHNQMTGAAKYPIHTEMLHSAAPAMVFSKFGSYLLPMAYPEGCPPFSAYPEGHGTVAGACVTMLKAFFNEAFVIPKPVEASADGLSLAAYSGPPLTVGGELNKLAANVAIGRDTAGVHTRVDGIEGMALGEAVAIGILQDYSITYNEVFAGFSLTKFDGTTITINGAPPATTAVAQPKNSTTGAREIQLDGTGSVSYDGKPLQYGWQVVRGYGSASIQHATSAKPDVQFASGPRLYAFQLTVTDSSGATASDTATVNYVGQ